MSRFPVVLFVALGGCSSVLSGVDSFSLSGLIEHDAARTVATVDPGSEVTLLWRTFDPEQPSWPLTYEVSGDVPLEFAFNVLDPPPDEARFPIEESDGATVLPGASPVGMAQIALVSDGAVESDPIGVSALDHDLVLGMSDLVLFYTPVDLATTDGVRVWSTIEAPITAGYHLYDVETGVEHGLDELVTITLDYRWD